MSSWAQWAGLLSGASEIHVNAPPHHPMMSTMPQYIYHSEKNRKFFGKYYNSTKDVEFYWTPPNATTTSSPGDSKTNAATVAVEVVVTDTALVKGSLTTDQVTVPATTASTAVARDMTTASLPADPIKSVQPPIVELHSVLSDKDSLFERLRITGSTVGMWWWEHMQQK